MGPVGPHEAHQDMGPMWSMEPMGPMEPQIAILDGFCILSQELKYCDYKCVCSLFVCLMSYVTVQRGRTTMFTNVWAIVCHVTVALVR